MEDQALDGSLAGEFVFGICCDVSHRPTIDSDRCDDCFDGFVEPLCLSLDSSSSISVSRRRCGHCPREREGASGVFLLSFLASVCPHHSVRRPFAGEYRDVVLVRAVEAVSSAVASASASPSFQSVVGAVLVLFWSSGWLSV